MAMLNNQMVSWKLRQNKFQTSLGIANRPICCIFSQNNYNSFLPSAYLGLPSTSFGGLRKTNQPICLKKQLQLLSAYAGLQTGGLRKENEPTCYTNTLLFCWFGTKQIGPACCTNRRQLPLLSANFGLPAAILVVWEKQMGRFAWNGFQEKTRQLQLPSATFGLSSAFLLVWNNQMGQRAKQTKGNYSCYLLISAWHWQFWKSKWSNLLNKQKTTTTAIC